MIDKIIRSLYYSLFFATPLLMFSKTSELFEFNKMMLIYIIASFIAICWVLKIYYEKKLTFVKTSLDLPILIFLMSQFLSTFFSIDLHTSIFGYYGRFNGGLLSIIVYTFLYYGFVNLFPKDKIQNLLKLSLLSSLVVVLWGIPGKLGRDLSCLLFSGQASNSCWTDQFRPAERMFSTLGQPNWLGAYLAINFFIGIYFYIKKRELINIYLGYLTLNFLGILFSRSRSAFISLLIGSFFFLLIYIFRRREEFQKQIKKYILVFIALFLLVAIFKTGIDKIDNIFSWQNTKQKAAQINKKTNYVPSEITESLDIRKIVWKGALQLGLKYPLFGTGVETFGYSYYFVRPKEHNLTSEWDFLYNKAHNEYLNYLATTGFLGFGAYLFLIVSVIFLLLKKFKSDFDNNDDNLLIACVLVSYSTILFTNFFGFSTTTINLFFYLIPAFMVTSFAVEKNFKEKNLKIFSYSTIAILGFFIIFLTRYYLADINYALGKNYLSVDDYQAATFYLTNALKLHKEHVYEDKLSVALVNLALKYAALKDIQQVDSLITASNFYNQESLRWSPQNVLYWKTRASDDYFFYYIKNNSKYLYDGAEALKKARSLSPTDPKLPYSLAIYYSALADEIKNQRENFSRMSLIEVDKALELKPDYEDAYLLKAQLLKKYGRKEDAKVTLEYVLKKINPLSEEAKKELESL